MVLFSLSIQLKSEWLHAFSLEAVKDWAIETSFEIVFCLFFYPEDEVDSMISKRQFWYHENS